MVHAICLLRIHPRKHAGAGDNALYIEIRAVEPMERSDELRQGGSAGRGRIDVHSGRIPTQNQIARRAVWTACLQGEHGAGGVGRTERGSPPTRKTEDKKARHASDENLLQAKVRAIPCVICRRNIS